MITNIYNTFTKKLTAPTSTIDLSTDEIKLMLLTNAYVYAKTHATITDIQGSEVSDPTYTAGGNVAANTTWTQATDGMLLDSDNILFPTAEFLFRYAVFYSNNTNKDLICCLDLEADQDSEGAGFNFKTPNGILEL